VELHSRWDKLDSLSNRKGARFELKQAVHRQHQQQRAAQSAQAAEGPTSVLQFFTDLGDGGESFGGQDQPARRSIAGLIASAR
jgi:hypothetical protein